MEQCPATNHRGSRNISGDRGRRAACLRTGENLAAYAALFSFLVVPSARNISEKANGRARLSSARLASGETSNGVRAETVCGGPSSPPQSPTANEWLIWQLADSAFPSGGFAHSGGLEALWQHQLVRSNKDLLAFLQTALRQLGRGSLPFVNAAFTAAIENLVEIDRLCDAFTSSHVANRASRLQGQAFLSSAERTFGSAQLATLRTTVRDQQVPGHFAPLFGAICSALNIDRSA